MAAAWLPTRSAMPRPTTSTGLRAAAGRFPKMDSVRSSTSFTSKRAVAKAAAVVLDGLEERGAEVVGPRQWVPGFAGTGRHLLIKAESCPPT